MIFTLLVIFGFCTNTSGPIWATEIGSSEIREIQPFQRVISESHPMFGITAITPPLDIPLTRQTPPRRDLIDLMSSKIIIAGVRPAVPSVSLVPDLIIRVDGCNYNEAVVCRDRLKRDCKRTCFHLCKHPDIIKDKEYSKRCTDNCYFSGCGGHNPATRDLQWDYNQCLRTCGS